MKLRANLGVKTVEELQSPQECYRLGEKASRVSDGLLFAEFLLGGGPNKKNKLFTKTELDLVWAGVHSSGGIAMALTYSGLPPATTESAKKYNHAADLLSKRVKAYTTPKKAGDALPEYTQAAQDRLKSDVEKLRKRANELIEEVSKACHIEKDGKTLSGNVIRASMGSAKPAKAAAPEVMPKRIYPSFSRPAFHKNRRKP